MAPAAGSATKKAPVADSWDDASSEDETPAAPAARIARPSPPRPSGPPQPWDDDYQASSTASKDAADPNKRPEKSTAVASRLIAAGLGIKAPRRTEEQREYDKAVRAQERKKKEAAIQEEKRKVEERQKAQAAMWGD